MRVRRKVIFVNPPNTDDLTDIYVKTVTKGVQHTDWANFPHLGILALASYIDQDERFEAVYFDGVACPWELINSYIATHRADILALCVSTITANYGAGLQLCERAKAMDPQIRTIAGNDHFTAMYHRIMRLRHDLIDFGFVGNEGCRRRGGWI